MPSLEARVAHQVLAKDLRVRPGESVVIESWTHALPYVGPFVQEVRRLGAHPTVLYEDEPSWWNAVQERHLGVLSKMSRVEKAVIGAADVFVHFWGPEDRPRRDRLPEATREKIVEWNNDWYRLAHRSGLRGCRMTVGLATNPEARRFRLNGASWRRRLLEATLVDPEALRRQGRRIARRLERGKELRVRHANGTDLRLTLSGVHTRVDVGVPDRAALRRPFGMLGSVPGGQVQAAVDESRAEGTFVSNRAVYLGADWFDGARWSFVKGRLTRRAMAHGGTTFERDFRKAPAGKDRLGYLSIGLNPGARALPPCEDTESGSLLVGVGANAFVGGSRSIPFVGYALLGDGTISIDGRKVAEDGHIV